MSPQIDPRFVFKDIKEDGNNQLKISNIQQTRPRLLERKDRVLFNKSVQQQCGIKLADGLTEDYLSLLLGHVTHFYKW